MTSYPESFNETMLHALDEGFPLLMPKWGYVVSAIVLFLIGFFGFFLNLFVILLMFKDRQLWTPLNIILFNLVCSDFSVSVLGNPFTLTSALFHRWVFGRTMCVLYGFFMALLGIASITTLTVISFERYLMVTRPLNSRHRSSKGAVLAIVFIWTYSLTLTIPPLIGWGNYVNEAANISCSVNWHEQSRNTLTYIMFLFAFGQIVPLTVIAFSYINIIRTLKKNSKRLGRVSRAETKATAMVFIMIIAFTVAWTPYSVFALLEQFATDGIISPGAGVIPALVAKSSICYNPLIYVGMNTQFRQSINRLFGMHNKGKQSHDERGFNNTLKSPAHKLTVENETQRTTSEITISTIPKKVKDTKKIIFSDSISEMTNNKNNRHYARDLELCTINENRTASKGEKSGDTTCDDDSGISQKKIELFSESCIVTRGDKKSPVVTIIDTEHLIFSKLGNNEHADSVNDAYGNAAYEEHFTDNTNDVHQTENATKRHQTIKHSYSLDLSVVANENKSRNPSIETKFETLIQAKGFLKETVISKLFDPDSKQDGIKSFLNKVDKNDNNENNL